MQWCNHVTRKVERSGQLFARTLAAPSLAISIMTGATAHYPLLKLRIFHAERRKKDPIQLTKATDVVNSRVLSLLLYPARRSICIANFSTEPWNVVRRYRHNTVSENKPFVLLFSTCATGEDHAYHLPCFPFAPPSCTHFLPWDMGIFFRAVAPSLFRFDCERSVFKRQTPERGCWSDSPPPPAGAFLCNVAQRSEITFHFCLLNIVCIHWSGLQIKTTTEQRVVCGA